MGRSYTLHTLSKGLGLLETLAAESDLSLTELAERLAESRTGVFRLLRTLQERGYVEQHGASKRYRLGLHAWEIGCRAVRRTGVVEAGQPILRWLSHVTGETAILAALRELDVLYLDVVWGPGPLRVCTEPGTRAPAYASASGRAMLAHRPDVLPRVLDAALPRITPQTVSTPAQLRRRLAEVRRTGAAVSRGERREDITSAAAPVFDRHGQCVAAVSVAGPATRMRDEKLDEVTRRVRKAAQELSAKLGGLKEDLDGSQST
jgi:DNA-binding IclR family transcriptional regulator